MSDREVSIVLKAVDQISRVFKQVGDAGKKMGADLSHGADQAERDLKDLGETSKRTAVDIKELEREAKYLGLGIGALVGGLALAGQSYRDQQVALDSLRRTYGEAATDLERFAEQIQDTTNFSNDAAVESANLFGTLARNYGLTADEIQNLIQVSADLAAVTGMGLADASQRVAAAIRGEAESAELLGLTLNDAALGIDRMSKSTTDHEKAQIRVNALMEQAAFALGAASDQADTTYGSVIDLRDGFQDAAQSLGEFLGPFGEIGAAAADNATQLLVMSAGLSAVGRSALAAQRLIGMAGLTGSLGAAGLVGAISIAYLALDELGNNLESSTEALERMDVAAADLDETVRQLFATGNQLAYLGEQGLELFPGIEQDIENMSNLESQIATLMAAGGPQNDQQREMLQGWQSDLDGLIVKYGDLDSAQLESTEYATLFADAQEAFNEILTHTGVGAADAQAALRGVVDAFQDGNLTAPQFAETVVLLASGLQTYDEVATDAAVATNELAAAQQAYGAALGNTWQMMAGAATIEEGRKAQQDALTDGLLIATDTLVTFDEEMRGNIVTGNSWSAMAAAGAVAIVEWSDVVEGVRERLSETFESIQAQLLATTNALDAGFRTAIGNTDAWASQAQGVADWAEELIKAEGVYSRLDELVAAGRVTGTSGIFGDGSEYAMAQEAYNAIQLYNEAIQEHVDVIQAKQAPAMADLMQQQEAYLQSLADAPAEQQTFALAMMDTATAAEALGLAQSFIADQDTFGPMVQQAAELNPYLASILEQMGIISIGANGDITVNADDAQSEVSLLTEAIENLTEAIWTATVGVDDQASGPLSGILGQLELIDGKVAISTVQTQYYTIGTPGGMFFQHGGMVDAAQHGRMIGSASWVGEAGPELLLGGNHVLPHTASMQTGGNTGGINVHIEVHGSVGVEDLAEQVSEKSFQRFNGHRNYMRGGTGDSIERIDS